MTDQENANMIKIVHTPVSMTQLIGWAVIIIAQAVTAGGVYVSMNNKIDNAATKEDVLLIKAQQEENNRFRDRRTVQTDGKFTDISVQLSVLPQLQFAMQQTTKEVAEQKTRIDETNKRMDRIVELFGDKLDGISNDINTVKSDVRVLTSKVELLTPEKRAELERPPAELTVR